MTQVIVVLGAGSIGQAIARRVSAGKHVLLADLRQANADAAAKVLSEAGFEVTAVTVDVSSRASVEALVKAATDLGDVTGVIHAAGVSPSQASPATILSVDLYGTALVLESFGHVIANGGSGVVIASMSGHRLPALTPEQDKALATTPTDELLSLPMLQPDQVSDPLSAYQISKRGNALRVMAQAVRWGRRGARVNTISPGIIVTPLAKDELAGPRGAGYRRMLEGSPAGRAGTPDEVGALGAFLMGPDGAFVTGSDFLMDGGVTAAYWYGWPGPIRTRRLEPRAKPKRAYRHMPPPRTLRALEAASVSGSKTIKHNTRTCDEDLVCSPRCDYRCRISHHGRRRGRQRLHQGGRGGRRGRARRGASRPARRRWGLRGWAAYGQQEGKRSRSGGSRPESPGRRICQCPRQAVGDAKHCVEACLANQPGKVASISFRVNGCSRFASLAAISSSAP
jgi:NAD(P)-dependent dehydrogenase (short-subunit alcohol dehydrogenase family)